MQEGQTKLYGSFLGIERVDTRSFLRLDRPTTLSSPRGRFVLTLRRFVFALCFCLSVFERGWRLSM